MAIGPGEMFAVFALPERRAGSARPSTSEGAENLSCADFADQAGAIFAGVKIAGVAEGEVREAQQPCLLERRSIGRGLGIGSGDDGLHRQRSEGLNRRRGPVDQRRDVPLRIDRELVESSTRASPPEYSCRRERSESTYR